MDINRIKVDIDKIKSGEYIWIHEELALSMLAGARAIEQHHYHGVYIYDVFNPHNNCVDYIEAAALLRAIAYAVMEGEQA